MGYRCGEALPADGEQQAHIAVVIASGFRNGDLDLLVVEPQGLEVADAVCARRGRYEGEDRAGEPALGRVGDADEDGAGDGAVDF